MELTGKVAIVTGAGSGMGRAIAHTFADAGCKVVALGRTESKLSETVATYSGPGHIDAQKCDVSSLEQVRSLVAKVRQEYGTVDILVNNAGVNIRNRKLADLSPEDWEYLIQVNLNGCFYLIHEVLPTMRQQKSGLVINISSISGVRPSSLGGAAYSASKFGLNALSGVLALEEGINGIRSTVICPGEAETPILDQRPEPVSVERRASMLQPQDIADAALFVAKLHPRAHVPELIIKPTVQDFA